MSFATRILLQMVVIFFQFSTSESGPLQKKKNWTLLQNECNSLVHVHWTSEFTASPLGPIHYDQWIHSKSNENTWCTKTPFVVVEFCDAPTTK
jgi:hypothetical protein